MNIWKRAGHKIGGWLGVRTLENPAVSLASDEAYDLLTANGPSKISKFGAIWKAVNLISKAIAKTPLNICEKTAGGRKKLSGTFANLLLWQPNDQQTAFVFKMQMTFTALYHGNAYAYIERDRMMNVVGLHPLNHQTTYPIRRNGELWYVVSLNGNPQFKLRPWEVLHIRGVGDDLMGWSLKDLAKVSFDMAVMAQTYSKKYFQNGARPAVVLEHPKTLTQEAAQKLKSSWNQMYAGVENAHRTAVLEEGLKANPIASSARDAMLIDSMQFSIVDVANWFEIPPHKLGDSAKSSYNSIEQENLNYLADTLDPWMTCWEQECRMKILTEDEKVRALLYFEFNRNALIQVDFKTRMASYKAALAGAPFLLINEIRRMENLDDLPVGDVLRFPSNNFGDVVDPSVQVDPPTDPDPDGSGTGSAASRQLSVAELIQKIYLGIGKVVDVDEARAILNAGGANLSIPAPASLLPPAPATEPPAADPGNRAVAAARDMLQHVKTRMLTRVAKDYRTAVKNKEMQLWFDGFDTKHGDVIRRELQLVASILEPLTGEADVTERTITEIMETIKNGNA